MSLKAGRCCMHVVVKSLLVAAACMWLLSPHCKATPLRVNQTAQPFTPSEVSGESKPAALSTNFNVTHALLRSLHSENVFA